MSILLGILKIIGIIILVILGLLLLILLTVLFVPARYRASATTNGDITQTRDLKLLEAMMEVTWFFQMVHVYMELREARIRVGVRVAWKRIIEKERNAFGPDSDEEDDKPDATDQMARETLHAMDTLESLETVEVPNVTDALSNLQAGLAQMGPKAWDTKAAAREMEASFYKSNETAKTPQRGDALEADGTGEGQAGQPEGRSAGSDGSAGSVGPTGKSDAGGTPGGSAVGSAAPAGSDPLADLAALMKRLGKGCKKLFGKLLDFLDRLTSEGDSNAGKGSVPASASDADAQDFRQKIEAAWERAEDPKAPGIVTVMVQKATDRFFDLLFKLEDRLDSLEDKNDGIRKKLREISPLTDWKSRNYYLWAWYKFLSMLRHFRVRKATGYLCFGTGFPHYTGMLSGMIWYLLPFQFMVDPELVRGSGEGGDRDGNGKGDRNEARNEDRSANDPTENKNETENRPLSPKNRFVLSPDFYDLTLDVEGEFSGHVRMWYVVRMVLQAVVKRDTWEMLKKIKNRRRKGNG